MSAFPIEVASLIVAIALWWFGIRKVVLTSAAKSVLSALELILLIATVIALGWTGLVIFAAANIVGLLAYSVRLAWLKESILVEAANRTDSSKEEMYDLHERLHQSDSLKWVGPIALAEWIRELAYRDRDLAEIEAITPPLGKLSLVYGHPDAKWLIAKFDQLLRLNGEPASQSEKVAETIYGSVKASAATFPEMLEALIAVVSPFEDDAATG